jgi:signal transduction histidine kinase/CheY-like chemotaxis protein
LSPEPSEDPNAVAQHRTQRDLLDALRSLPAVPFTFHLDPEARDRLRVWSLDRDGNEEPAPGFRDVDLEALSLLVDPEELPGIQRALAEARSAASSFDIIVTTRGTGDGRRWIRLQGQPGAARGDQPATWHGLARDVTSERRSAAFARTQRNLLERIATGTALPTVLDDVCRLVEQRIEGSRASVLLIDPLRRTLRFGAAPTIEVEYVKALEGLEIGPDVGSCGTAMYYGTPVVSPDIGTDPKWAAYRKLAETYRLGACWSVPFFGADGKVAGALSAYFEQPRHPTSGELEVVKTAAHVAGIASQRTAMLEALHLTEEQLRQAQKMEAVGQLSGGVAHDFNNILTVIRGSASMLVDSLPEGSEERSDAELIVEATARAETLTRQLLTFGRRQAWQPSAVSVNEIIRRNDGIIHRLLGERVDVRLALEADLPPVWVDEAQLEQVLMNLAVNARDAMAEGGRLDIVTGLYEVEDETADLGAPAGASFVRLEVRDSGVGMDQSTLARAFEPFFSTKPRESSSGLGLSVAYGIVERAGGKISVTSQPGGGTTVRIDLPASAEAPVVQPRAAGSLPHASLARDRAVLLVEDEPMVRSLAARTLRSRGYEVVEAEDGQAGLQALESRAGGVDIVVSDVVMPRMTGTELAQTIADRWPNVPVLLMTGYADDMSLLGQRGPEAPPLLSKPFTPSQLAREVQRALGD